MIVENAAVVASGESGAEPALRKEDFNVNPVDFIAGLAALLSGTVERLEKTSGSVTGSLMGRAEAVDRELVVALQNFDRLQQEFVALRNALTRVAERLRESSRAGEGLPAVGSDAIAAIAVSDLTERLLNHLRDAAEDRPAPVCGDEDDEKVF